MTITTRLFTFFKGKQVGSDEFGNRYFTEKSNPKYGRAKRWVLYNGKAEPSKIPASWHGWMHYTTDKLPTEINRTPNFWEAQHKPNLTGTKNAYYPTDTVAKPDYQAWQPK